MSEGQEIMREVFSILTELSHPKYLEKLGPELFVRISSARMSLSPTAIREVLTIKPDKAEEPR